MKINQQVNKKISIILVLILLNLILVTAQTTPPPPPPCTPNWQCTNYGNCNGGIETRICTDQNNCGTTTNKPTETRCCDVCTEGQKQCSAKKDTQTCVRETSGCTRWQIPTTCPTTPTEEYCYLGNCCEPICVIGQTKCTLDTQQLQTCTNTQGCPNWATPTQCSQGKFCLGDSCVQGCTQNTDCPTGQTCDQISHACQTSQSAIEAMKRAVDWDTGNILPIFVEQRQYFPTTGGLIKNQNKCGKVLAYAIENANEPHAVCQPWGQWMYTQKIEDTIEKINPFGTDLNKIPTTLKCARNFHHEGCCSQTQCWDGKICKNNGEITEAGKKGFICNNGNWEQKPVKINYDKTETAFCPRDDQCLVTKIGNPTNNDQVKTYFTANSKSQQPQCVSHKQYLKDEYCDNGIWTTRTKLLAVQLISFAEQIQNNKPQKDYDLFCDDYINTLNTVKYNSGKGIVENFIKENNCVKEETTKKVPCVNNFCVLKTPEGVKAIATSLNTKINSLTSFLNALNLDKTFCDNAITLIGFNKCSPQATTSVGQVWYNPEIESIIYLPQQLTTNIQDTYTETQLKTILDYASTKDPTDPMQNFPFLTQTSQYNKIFYSKKDSRGIFAVMEKQPTTDPALQNYYVGIKYTGFSIGGDPCLFFKKYFDPKSICEKQTKEYDFVLLSKGIKDQTQITKWLDLTSKLRLMPGPITKMSTDVTTPQQTAQIQPEEIEPACT